MTCAETSGLILEADPIDLDGSGDGPLAQHLRACPRCRVLAQTVLEQEAALGRELAASVLMPDIEGLLGRDSESKSEAPLPIRTRVRRLGFGLLPLAAAAAMASLLLSGEPQMPGEPYSPHETPPGLGLEVPEGQDVAVLATNDPNITVLWFF